MKDERLKIITELKKHEMMDYYNKWRCLKGLDNKYSKLVVPVLCKTIMNIDKMFPTIKFEKKIKPV